MSRVRMDWDWVKGYPIFIFTSWIDHNKFHVKLVKGVYGNQNAGNTRLPPVLRKCFTEWLFCLDGKGYEEHCKMVAEFYGWEAAND